MIIDDLKNLYVTRERDLYTFGILGENNQVIKKVQYQFGDECYAIGVSGKRVKACPRVGFLPSYITELMWNSVRNNATNYLNREYFDRLVSLPIGTGLKFLLLNAVARSTKKRVDEERTGIKWSELMAILKKYGEEKILKACSVLVPRATLRLIYETLVADEFFDKYNMNEQREMLYKSSYFDVRFLEVKAFREAVKHAWKDPYEEAQNKVRELFPTLTDAEINDYLGIRFYKYNRTDALRKVCCDMNEITEMLGEMENTTYKLTNITRDKEIILGMYKENQRERENKKFEKYQTEYDLHFENNLYRIIVPTTREELAEIGKKFNNCANAWEWNVRLYDGSFHLVVVEDKASGEWKVCVDIYSSTLTICQYLGYNNSYIRSNSPLNTFYEEYQKYLESLKEAK